MYGGNKRRKVLVNDIDMNMINERGVPVANGNDNDWTHKQQYTQY